MFSMLLAVQKSVSMLLKLYDLARVEFSLGFNQKGVYNPILLAIENPVIISVGFTPFSLQVMFKNLNLVEIRSVLLCVGSNHKLLLFQRCKDI